MQKNNLKKQSGIVLVISMIFLVILTMLGLSSMQGTMTEIAMSGNLRESDLSFQTAEMGLVSAEEYIEESISNTVYDNNNGLLSSTADDPNYFADANWASVQTSTATINNVYSSPKFIIKHLGDRSQNEVASVNIGGYGSGQPGRTIDYFRSTSRGYGQTDRATTMVQSYFGREF